ncbi:hypothetical protein FFLO_06412 [Filobasidium floriforme]|uniref:Uncharacterized protein n=1 Tax=Filobasidium floriforme TaxID=5210 RepID=A0A8K0JEY7_9TREE|nr:uncharacterized protein HD553DRAFT_363738 [Filobasidium floriforme]KAG7528098.1 hypothetical protein FFLO_06412 [Filobasidium floriforme]KAH8079033.1 hypothetical protein HD553DRAFT_363738 [Filobasidium floriforme]
MAANQTLTTNCFMAGLPEDRLFYFQDEQEHMSLEWLQAHLACGDVKLRYRNLGSAPEAEAEIRAAIEEYSWYEPIKSIRYNTDFHLFYVSGLVEEGLRRSSLDESTAWFSISKSHPDVILRLVRGSQIGPLWVHTATFMCDPLGEHFPHEALNPIPEPPRLVAEDVETEPTMDIAGPSTKDFAFTESQAKETDDDDKNSIASSESRRTAICHAPSQSSRIISITDVGFTPVKEIDVLDSLEKSL